MLNFIYDAYNDKSGTLDVPESLQMKKDVSNRREASELKAYRTKNRSCLKTVSCVCMSIYIFVFVQKGHVLTHAYFI